MGNTGSSTDSDDDHHTTHKDDDGSSDGELENEKDPAQIIDLQMLFDHTSLRTAAAKVKDDMPDNVVQQHRAQLLMWLEERQKRNEDTITLAQFCDVLMGRSVGRDEAIQAFQQFDTEGDGTADVTAMMEALRNSNSANMAGELGYVVRSLQACSLTPGFVDVYNEDRQTVGQHGARILNFLLRNRAPSSSLPFPMLNGFNNTVNMRLATVRNHFSKLKDVACLQQEASMLCEGEEMKTITRCWKNIEVSTNKTDANRLTNGETSSFWQSDGSARTHWIRLHMRTNVVIKQLSVVVASSDQSYMPQLITVAVGKNPNSLHDIKDVRIPSHITGDVSLLENVKTFYPVIQLNIKRCHSDGCDTRIHEVKTLGYRITKESTISVMDASASWFLQVLASTATAAIPVNPSLRTSLLQHTKLALQHMPPLSLSPTSSERPRVLSGHVLKEVDQFLKDISGDDCLEVHEEALYVMLAFNLAWGHVAGILNALQCLQENKGFKLEATKLLRSLISVRNSFWRKHSGLVTLSLVGSDGGQKEETSGPQNVLASNWTTAQAYLTKDGQTKVNMFFKSTDYIQVTKIRIKVDKGPRGPKHGLVFVYNESKPFVLEEQVEKFKKFDTWTATTFALADKCRSAGIPTTTQEDGPLAHFTLEDDWDEVEVPMETCPVGQYILVKFLEARQPQAERLGIVGIKFYGYKRKGIFVDASYLSREFTIPAENRPVDSATVSYWTLEFLVSLARDHVPPKPDMLKNKPQSLDMSAVSVSQIWSLYNAFSNRVHQNLMLQLLHSLFPFLVGTAGKQREACETLFQYLCHLVDNPPASANGSIEDHLLTIAKQVIVDGAAVFFPDKEARRKQLFNMMTDINGTAEVPSVSLVFQSLCQFFGSVDPSGLLDLPLSLDKPFDSAPVLAVMETLVSVVAREFLKVLETVEVTSQASHLGQLLCSLQTALLCWCQRQINSEEKQHGVIAQDVLVKYVLLLMKKATDACEIFQKRSPEEMASLVSKLDTTFISTTVRQLVLILMLLSKELAPSTHVSLLKLLMPLATELHQIAVLMPDHFYKVESDHWQELGESDAVLRTWEVESTHNYENNLHTTQIFSCPGASTFTVEFDPRCETEKRYDYLEFTDSRGAKVRYDQKVGTDKWPVSVTFKSGHRLQFHFHSDSSNNEWGYKFKVVATGTPDVPLCWMFDLQLSLAKLLGQLCGATLDRSAVMKPILLEDQEDPEAELLQSDLWTTLFRGGYRIGKLQWSLSRKHAAVKDSRVLDLLWSVVEGEDGDGKVLIQRCREQMTGPQIGGADLDAAVLAVFSALVWHTQTLREELEKIKEEKLSDCTLSDGIIQAYNLAESVRKMLMAQRQNLKAAAEGSNTEVDVNAPVTQCTEKALFLLKFAGLQRVHLKTESKPKLHRQSSRFTRLPRGFKNINMEGTMEKYPSFRLVLEFVRDPAWTKDRVEELLKERSQRAVAVAEVYMFASEYIRIMTVDHIFQVPVVLFLQHLLTYQEGFAHHYADGLDGCGLEQEARVRQAYYALIQRLVEAICSVKRQDLQRPVVAAYDYIQACGLHLLDIHWQMYDLSFLVDQKLPELYMTMAKGSVSMREKLVSEPDREKELALYKKDMAWLEECKKDFMDWYKNTPSSTGKDGKRAMQMFVAKFCDLLEVEVNCDGCGVTLPGRRYRCLQCEDMDLCTTCYSGGVEPGGKHTDDHEIVHMMYKCDECQAFIVGTRLHCKVCDDFDLCLGCHVHAQFPAGHSSDHEMETFPMIKLKLSKDSDSSLQSYIHQHVWLLFASMSLSMAAVMYSNEQANTGEMHADYIKACSQLHHMCLELSNRCLIKVTSPTSDDQEVEDSPELLETRQEEAFASHAQERIMGLLGAMIPPEKKVPISDEVNYTFTSENFLKLLFQIASGESGHETNTQHLAMGLLGQLLQRTATSCSSVDTAVALARNITIPSEAAAGAHTVEYLFSFGATCLERSGLEWANSMASILQKMFASPSWKDILLQHLGTSIQKLKEASAESPPLPMSSMAAVAARDRKRYEELFLEADANNKGHVTEDKLREVLEPKLGGEAVWKSFWIVARCLRLCYTDSKGGLQPIRKLCGFEDTGEINLEQFCLLMMLFEKQHGKVKIAEPSPERLPSKNEATQEKKTVNDVDLANQQENNTAKDEKKAKQEQVTGGEKDAAEKEQQQGEATSTAGKEQKSTVDLKRSSTPGNDKNPAVVTADSEESEGKEDLKKLENPALVKPAGTGESESEEDSAVEKGTKSDPELSSIFALFVIAGFPEVLSIGATVRYSDFSTESKKGVVLKHFPDKHQTLLVDLKTRRRKTKKDEYVECESHDLQVLDQQHICAFIDVIKETTARVEQGTCVSVENMWVLSLSLKSLLRSLQGGLDCCIPALHTAEFVQAAIYLASQGTGFSKQWLLKDLEILSLMLYTRDQDKLEENSEEQKKKSAEEESCSSSDENNLDPWQGLDMASVTAFNMLHTHQHIPIPVLRAVYELHGCDANALMMAVHESASHSGTFTPSEEEKSLARKWDVRSNSTNVLDKTVDTGMQLTLIRPLSDRTVDEAVGEASEDSQKLISAVDTNMSSEAAKQRKNRSAIMLKKELEAQGKAASRDFLLKVNRAMSILYARHVLMKLLADWPASIPLNIGCQDDVQVPFILDLLNQYDSQDTFQKVVQNVISCYSVDCIVPIAMAACQFLEEVNLSTVMKESEHPYKNNTRVESHVTIPGVAFLSVHFDSKCGTEEGCDELVTSTSSDFTQSRRVFSGPKEHWTDFELAGDTLFYKFESDGSNTDWGYKFTVTGGKIGRFDTGYMILKSIFGMMQVAKRLPVSDLWQSLVFVACKQTGQQRLKALHLMLKILQSQFRHVGCEKLAVDLGLLRPLWALYAKLGSESPDSSSLVSPVIRALTEVFLIAENLAMDWSVSEQYLISLLSTEDVHKMVYQGIENVAAVSVMIGVTNKATEIMSKVHASSTKEKKEK